MKKHSGMRPHDIAILLKILSKEQDNWYMKDLSQELNISASEISESINRSVIAGLMSADKKNLNKLALLDFLKFGFRFVYPQRPGAMVRGLETAHSAPPLSSKLISEDIYVWPYAKGKVRGQAIEPLHPSIPEACVRDEKYYELIALADALRIGKAREQNIAFELIKEKFIYAKKPNHKPKSG